METVVLYPSPGMGHLISMVELGKLILSHHSSFTINILITTPPIKMGSTASYIATISSTTPSITFHQLPTISMDPNSYPTIEALVFDLLHLNNTHVHAALKSLSLISTIRAFIIDLFCSTALDIATELNIPLYYFFTSSASCLAMFLHLPTIHQNTTKSFKDMNTNLYIPNLPPIPSSHVPDPVLNRSTKDYECFISCTASLSKSAGIITNTFESLEPKAVKALLDGVCIPHGPTPPVSCIGPLIATNDGGNNSGHECLTWLNSQPSRSVVFLCFGSMGLFSKQQLHEIALGLDRSGLRFLWVVRNPPSKDQKSNTVFALSDPDLNSLLPDGFLDRTKDRGLVVKSWAPQVAVLSHDSVGGFVTHCGWNSVLESICAGMPMIAWPLYAEQKFNKIVLVEELKLALPMNEMENGLVSADEVEKRVRELMDSEEGNSVRERVVAKKNEAMIAISEGGSSRVALSKLVELWKLK